MRINKEGFNIIISTLLVMMLGAAALFIWTPLWLAIAFSAAFLILIILIAAFFREPSRSHLQNAGTVFSPADGRVVAVEETDEKEYFGDRRIQVSVFMSISNVHVNWFPVGGTVEYFKYHPGKFLVAWHPKSSEDNERTTTVVNTGICSILFRQVAGMVARRIVSYARVGEKVEQNTKCGFIKFGSRLDVLLPTDCEVLVKIGDRVTGSQTPIARIKHR